MKRKFKISSRMHKESVLVVASRDSIRGGYTLWHEKAEKLSPLVALPMFCVREFKINYTVQPVFQGETV